MHVAGASGRVVPGPGDIPRKLSRFWILLALSGTIATAGILIESTATVIGAMIVAPLGTPIMGIGLAAVVGDSRRLWRSAAFVVSGAVAVVLLAAFLAWILRKRGAYLVIAAALVLILLPLGLTAAQTAREQVWLRRASTVASAWAAQRGYALEDVNFEGSDLYVAIEGSGPRPVEFSTASPAARSAARGHTSHCAHHHRWAAPHWPRAWIVHLLRPGGPAVQLL